MAVSYAVRNAVFGLPGAGPRVLTMTPWSISVQCHGLIAPRFRDACRAALAASSWRPRRIDSYANRAVRGSTAASLHAYGLAWDFFDRPLPEPVDIWGPTNAPDDAFLNAFKAHGFRLGRDFSGRKDWPHIEWADGHPGSTTVAVPVAVKEEDMPLNDDDMAKISAVVAKQVQTEVVKALVDLGIASNAGQAAANSSALHKLLLDTELGTDPAGKPINAEWLLKYLWVSVKDLSTETGGLTQADLKAALVEILRDGVGS